MQISLKSFKYFSILLEFPVIPSVSVNFQPQIVFIVSISITLKQNGQKLFLLVDSVQSYVHIICNLNKSLTVFQNTACDFVLLWE